MTRQELNNQINKNITSDELHEDEVMENIMQMIDAHVTEQLRIAGVLYSSGKSKTN